ncbi:MAG: MBL fold metallo-hydrolase [Spirochaetaceae bacterium]|uniref:MBL fold metallo-hydrolase n=1 Tax=Sphaerochaeta halotolerans TaxID=2293840 RepID=A0A372MFH7_9SPIR|nr:MBL fold metallo-hydrolase [Sphaerochaeta halotolerans]MBG0766271.1 MBL fold metallo-hydrolase [Spirochaetaceae bacterium]RFU94537.1 MBL fold metallo-hydrolase [Sphaerochaeta halotolerans]
MNIYQHFSVVGFCNTYLVAREKGSEALLIDPGHVDTELINMIETNRYTLKHVLLTHRHPSHSEGLGTLKKIYNVEVHASAFSSYEFLYHPIEDAEVLNLCGLKIEVIHVPGHSLDSMAYRIDHALFTGDTLLCGRIGSTPGYREQALLISSINQKLMKLDENILIFPGHGSASKLRIERMFNHDLLQLGKIETERQNWREDE